MAKVILRSVYDKSLADQLKIILDKNGVKNKLIRSQSNIEAVYLAQNSNPAELYVDETDVPKAEEILARVFKPDDTELDISAFSDDELIDVVLNRDEWHESFITKARELIARRNIIIPDEKVKENEARKNMAKSEGIRAGFAKLAFFWIITVFTGVYGLVAAYVFWRVKANGAAGEKYYYYNHATRMHGKWMFIVGLIICAAYGYFIIDAKHR
jgi:hypothetical protein